MTKDEALKQALSDAKRKERHFTVAETRYWLEQYKLIAEQALNDASHLAAPVQPAEELERERALELSRAYQEGYERAIQNITPPAAPVQEPVAWISPYGSIHFEPWLDSAPLYTAPPAAPVQEHSALIPSSLAENQFERYYRQGYDAGFKAQRQWVGLTNEELDQASWDFSEYEGFQHGARWAQEQLKEKNNG